MKKGIISVTLSFLIAGMLSACGHKHVWSDATCTEAKTCIECGETEGSPLGHSWTAATCTTPKTCTVCGETEGSPLGHSWTVATCTTPKTCTVCGETEGIPVEHQLDEDGICKQCGTSVGIDISIDNWKKFFSVDYEIISDKGLIPGPLVNSEGYYYTGIKLNLSPLKEGKYENVVLTYTLTTKDNYAPPRCCFENEDTVGQLNISEQGACYEEIIITANKKPSNTRLAYLLPSLSMSIKEINGHYYK